MTRRPYGERVAVALGSNLGDRVALLRSAVRGLRRLLDPLHLSGVYETDPLLVLDQPSFLNACCTGRTRLSPRQLLTELQHVEGRAGRVRGARRYGPRSLDLDLLLFGSRVVEAEDLVLPHPRMRERGFVLIPLAEIAADWVVPGGLGDAAATVGELAAAVASEGVRRTSILLEEP